GRLPAARGCGIGSCAPVGDAGGGDRVCRRVVGVGGAMSPVEPFCERDIWIDGSDDPAAVAVGRDSALSGADGGLCRGSAGGNGGAVAESGLEGKARGDSLDRHGGGGGNSDRVDYRNARIAPIDGGAADDGSGNGSGGVFWTMVESASDDGTGGRFCVGSPGTGDGVGGRSASELPGHERGRVKYILRCANADLWRKRGGACICDGAQIDVPGISASRSGVCVGDLGEPESDTRRIGRGLGSGVPGAGCGVLLGCAEKICGSRDATKPAGECELCSSIGAGEQHAVAQRKFASGGIEPGGDGRGSRVHTDEIPESGDP